MDEVLVVVNQPASIEFLPLVLSRDRRCPIAYLPGLTMRRIADLNPGEAKTDAREAFIIADAARPMSDMLRAIDGEEEMIAELDMIACFDNDLAGEATRVANRLHGLVTQVRSGSAPNLDDSNPFWPNAQRPPRDRHLGKEVGHSPLPTPSEPLHAVRVSAASPNRAGTCARCQCAMRPSTSSKRSRSRRAYGDGGTT